MAIISSKPRVGADAKLRIDNARVNNYLTDFNVDVNQDTANVRVIGESDNIFVATGKTDDLSMSGFYWEGETEWEDVLDRWETPNEQFLLQFAPEGENIPAKMRVMEVIGTGLSHSVPRDGIQTLGLTAQLSGFSGRFQFTDANSTLSAGDWLWSASNSHLALEEHRTAVSEPHFSARTITGLDADTKKILVIHTFKGISGFDTTFVTENDNNWQFGFYNPSQPAGETFWEPVTEYRRITTTTHHEVLLLDPPANMDNNHFGYKLDMSAIRNPPHQTYAVDFRFAVSFALI